MPDRVSDAPIPEELKHGRNCAAWKDGAGYDVNGEECTCGLRWRVEIQTLQTLRAAWEKRAYEAEATIARLEAEKQAAHTEGWNAGREDAAKEADLWASSPSCKQHSDNPCCHVRTGAGIADAIRRLHKPTAAQARRPVMEPILSAEIAEKTPCDWSGHRLSQHQWHNTVDGYQRCANCKNVRMKPARHDFGPTYEQIENRIGEAADDDTPTAAKPEPSSSSANRAEGRP